MAVCTTVAAVAAAVLAAMVVVSGVLSSTGDHPTTKMCLAAVEKYAGPGKRVLDIGCGSGILGIAAAVLGA